MVCWQAGFFSEPPLARNSRLPRLRPCSPEIRKKSRLFCRLSFSLIFPKWHQTKRTWEIINFRIKTSFVVLFLVGELIDFIIMSCSAHEAAHVLSHGFACVSEKKRPEIDCGTNTDATWPKWLLEKGRSCATLYSNALGFLSFFLKLNFIFIPYCEKESSTRLK